MTTKPPKPRPRAHERNCNCHACVIYQAHPHKRERGLALVAIQQVIADPNVDWREVWKGTSGYAIHVNREIDQGRLVKSGPAIRQNTKDGTSLLYAKRFFDRGEWQGWIALYEETEQKLKAEDWFLRTYRAMVADDMWAFHDRAEAAGVDPYGNTVLLYRFAMKEDK